MSDHCKDLRAAFKGLDEKIALPNVVVALFIMPTDYCRKAKMMPALASNGNPLKNAIADFHGVAPQYCVVKEDKYIAGSMHNSE